ncbi:MAG: sigma-70 family RNA polymerase sigma factor [bacterium]
MDPERLYIDYAPALYRYAFHQCGDAELASDIVQETFMRLIRQPPRDVSPRAWLFQVATNLAREWGRTGTRRERLLKIVPLDAAHSDAPRGPDADVLAREEYVVVHEALARLPERDRTILLMREQGFTHAEIAAAVGTTTKSVGTLAARAFTKLRTLLPSIRPS